MDVPRPEVRAVVPEFVLGGGWIVVDVGTGCISACEERIVLNPHPLGPAVEDADLTGIVAAGERSFHVDLPPGAYFLQLAARDDPQALWHVSDAREFTVLDPTDTDGDGFPDGLAADLCERWVQLMTTVFFRGNVCGSSAFGGGRGLLFVPQVVIREADSDDDGFPDSISLYATKVKLLPGRVEVGAELLGGAPFDTWDGAQGGPTPGSYYTCAPLPMLAGVVWEVDEDGDDLPMEVETIYPVTCIDLRYDRHIEIYYPSGWHGVDQDDRRPDPRPSGAIKLADPVVLYVFGEDADGDGIPSMAYALNVLVTYDPASAEPIVFTQYWSPRGMDLGDDDPDSPVLFVPLDEDGDRIPDLAEQAICDMNDPRTNTDGMCTIRGDFTPPALYVTHFSPRSNHVEIACDVAQSRLGASRCM